MFSSTSLASTGRAAAPFSPADRTAAPLGAGWSRGSIEQDGRPLAEQEGLPFSSIERGSVAAYEDCAERLKHGTAPVDNSEPLEPLLSRLFVTRKELGEVVERLRLPRDGLGDMVLPVDRTSSSVFQHPNLANFSSERKPVPLGSA